MKEEAKVCPPAPGCGGSGRACCVSGFILPSSSSSSSFSFFFFLSFLSLIIPFCGLFLFLACPDFARGIFELWGGLFWIFYAVRFYMFSGGGGSEEVMEQESYDTQRKEGMDGRRKWEHGEGGYCLSRAI